MAKSERDPTGLDAHTPGAKLDAGKLLAGVLSDFSLALTEIARVGTMGAEKYSRGGWQAVPDGLTRYTDAKWRHLLAQRHEPLDPESGLLHLAHEAWNALAVLELELRGQRAAAAAEVTRSGTRVGVSETVVVGGEINKEPGAVTYCQNAVEPQQEHVVFGGRLVPRAAR